MARWDSSEPGVEMKWQAVVEVTGEDGAVMRHAVNEGERTGPGQASTLGLRLTEGKATLAAVQRVLVEAQADAHCRCRRRCRHCGAMRPLKDHRPRRLVSLLGSMAVRAPRFGPCRCGVACRRSRTPGRGDHAGPLHPGVRARPGRDGRRFAVPGGRALLAELMPLDMAPEVETIRRRTLQIGARGWRSFHWTAVDYGLPVPAETITQSIDAGHVKSVRTYRMRSFEVSIARAGNDQGQEVVSSSMPAEVDRQARQLHQVLRGRGATATTLVTILSDGAVRWQRRCVAWRPASPIRPP